LPLWLVRTPRRDVAGISHSGGYAQTGKYPLHQHDISSEDEDEGQPVGHLASIDAKTGPLVTARFADARLITGIDYFDWTVSQPGSYLGVVGGIETAEASVFQLGILHRVSSIVSSDMSLDEMLGEVVGLAAQAAGCDACLVYLLDETSNELVLRASQVPHTAEIGALRMKIGEGITGWVAEHRSVVALPSKAAADARFKRFPALVEDTYEAFLSAPLLNAGQVIGVINVHHRRPHPHSPQEVATLTFIGEQLGVLISKSLLERENARLAEELEVRKLVERAKGILQKRHGITEEEAYLRLRNQSRRGRRAQ
jgi:putative methionine-R-sulfoxide reductase with GAF domain